MAESAESSAYDLITMGRIGVDLYPLQTGVPLPQVTSFGKFLGGSATNVAVAAARLGRRTAVVTRTGDDPFGTYLHEALRDFGVDDRWVTPGARAADAGHLLRGVPAGRLPAVLLPAAQGARPGDRRPRTGPGRHPRRPDLLGHGHGPERGAQPHGDARGPRPPRQVRHDGLRPGLAAGVLEGHSLERSGGRPALLRRGPAPHHGRRRQPRRGGGRDGRARARTRPPAPSWTRVWSWPWSSRAPRASWP